MSKDNLCASDLLNGSSDAYSSSAGSASGHNQVRWSMQVAMDLVKFADATAIVVAAFGTAFLHNYRIAGLQIDHLLPLQTALIVAIAAYYLMQRFGLYHAANMSNVPSNPQRLFVPLVLAFICVILVSFGLGAAGNLPITWYPTWFILAFAILVVERQIFARYLGEQARMGRFDKRLAIYGAGRIAKRLMDHLSCEAGTTRLVGVYDNRAKAGRGDLDVNIISGTLTDLVERARAHEIDQIIIALPQSANSRIAEVSRLLEQFPVELSICTHVSSDLIDQGATIRGVSAIGPVGLLNIKQKPFRDWAPILKSGEDHIVTAVLLALSLPLFALFALAIKLDSPGPVFFRQRRHGLNSRIIDVLKFRTMHVVEDESDVRQAERNDMRVTRVGHLLRRTSLDELPQLINVLRGEMSLIGPRPHALQHNEIYGAQFERYANRQQVKPGLTGWAQIHGFRGEVRDPSMMKQRVAHDLHYINNWSIWLDLKILIMTPFFGMVHRNAY